MDNKPKKPTIEEITKTLISWLRSRNHGDYGSYGYELYLPALAKVHYKDNKYKDEFGIEKDLFDEYSHMFYDAAWELCRRGILRPGIRDYQGQGTAEGASGNGYTITAFGKQWLTEKDSNDFVPTEPEAFGKYISQYKKFGDNFYQKAQEAIRCYGAHAYLSCCIMSGAAVEAILLSLYIEKYGKDEATKFFSKRPKVSQIKKELEKKFSIKNFEVFHDVMCYWRNESVHNTKINITEETAFLSIAYLLRACHLIDNTWNDK